MKSSDKVSIVTIVTLVRFHNRTVTIIPPTCPLNRTHLPYLSDRTIAIDMGTNSAMAFALTKPSYTLPKAMLAGFANQKKNIFQLVMLVIYMFLSAYLFKKQ